MLVSAGVRERRGATRQQPIHPSIDRGGGGPAKWLPGERDEIVPTVNFLPYSKRPSVGPSKSSFARRMDTAAHRPLKNRYMNRRAVGNQAYVPTEVEHLANVVTHGLSVLPSLLGLVFLLRQSSGQHQYFTCLIYGLSMVALFSISTFFHSVFYLGRFRLLKEILHRCDRAIIYIFIAASYTPWLTLKEIRPDSWARHLCWLVWLLALLGIIYQHFFHERYKTLETCFYAIIGIVPGFAIFSMCERSGVFELTAGGILYIVGVIFFKSDGRIPCAHAIWHLFVNIGATCHYYAICKYLLRTNDSYQIDSS